MGEAVKELKELLSQKESQLYRAELECNAWNKGKYKSSSNAILSKTFVEALRKEISEIHTRIANARKGSEDDEGK